MSKDRNRIKFINQNENQKHFFSTLTKRVNRYFKTHNLSKKANKEMISKSVIILSLYILPFIAFLILQPPVAISLLLWALMGFGMAGVGMNIMHDAIHGAYSNHPKVNKLMGYTLNLVGGAYFNWRIQHNVLHHTYTNISDWDEDINGKGTVRLEPHKEPKKVYKLQWLYAFFFYALTTLYWALSKDFVQLYKYTKSGLNTHSRKETLSILARITMLKVGYFSVLLVLPSVVFGIPFLHVLAGFLVMHAIAGVVLTVIFQLAHSVEGTEHPLPNKEGNIENAWAIHQMETTVNFARHNRFINWYVGGLNYQVEHHLFPQICHVHYPKIAPIVKETAEEFGVPYNENTTFRDAVRSHIRLLREYGKLPEWNEAIG